MKWHSARKRKIELKQYKRGTLSKTLMLGERHGHQRHQCMRLLVLYFKTIKMSGGVGGLCKKRWNAKRWEHLVMKFLHLYYSYSYMMLFIWYTKLNLTGIDFYQLYIILMSIEYINILNENIMHVVVNFRQKKCAYLQSW